jgi:site-specific DNA recombinase
MQAVIYCRVSTAEQTENMSLATQKKHCDDFCAREGFDVAVVFVERGESAKTAHRPELLKLVAYCQANKRTVRAVVVYSFSRFARNTSDHHQIRGMLMTWGISGRSVTERTDDSPTGKLMETVLAGLHQFDNDVRAERTIDGMQEALNRGRFCWLAPLGYLNARQKHGPSLLPDPDRATLIADAFELIASGRSAPEALRAVTDRGLRTMKGRPVSLQTFRTLLQNPIYAGRIQARKWNQERPGDFSALITAELFDRAQAALSRRPLSAGYRRAHPEFPLRRFVRCMGCDSPLTGSFSTGRNGTRYGYYHCPRCKTVKTTKGALDAAFVGLLDALRPRAEYVALFRAIVVDCWREAAQDAVQGRRAAEQRVRHIEDRINRVEEAFLFDRAIDRQTYNDQLERLRIERLDARARLDDLQDAQADTEGLLGFAEHVLTNAGSLWLGASPEDRTRLQTALFPNGLSWDGAEFGNAVTNSAFSYLRDVEAAAVGVASPPGFEPGFQP